MSSMASVIELPARALQDFSSESLYMHAAVATNQVMQEIIAALQHIEDTKYMILVGFTAMVYDHILTVDPEVRLIWRGRFGVVSALFLFNRYTVPLMLSVDIYENFALGGPDPVKFCRIWTIVQGYMTIINFMCVHVIVALRVHALLGGKTWVARLLWVTGSLYVVACVGLSVAALVPSISPWPNHLSVQLGQCYAILPSWLWLIWLPSVIFESLLFTLTMLAAVLQRREIAQWTSLSTILYRDGIMYFVAVSLCSLFSLLVWLTAPPTLIGLGRYFALAMINIAGSRLVLNLKSFAAHKREASAHAIHGSNFHSDPQPLYAQLPLRPSYSARPSYAREQSRYRNHPVSQRPTKADDLHTLPTQLGYDPEVASVSFGRVRPQTEQGGCHAHAVANHNGDEEGVGEDGYSTAPSSGLHRMKIPEAQDDFYPADHRTVNPMYSDAHLHNRFTDTHSTTGQSPTTADFAAPEHAYLLQRTHGHHSGRSEGVHIPRTYGEAPHASDDPFLPYMQGSRRQLHSLSHAPSSFAHDPPSRSRLSRASDYSGSEEVLYGYAQ